MVHKTNKEKIHVADPANGLLTYKHKEFFNAWTNTTDKTGFILLLEPNAKFYKQEKHKSFSFLYPYLKLYKN